MLTSKRGLVRVGDVEEAVWVLALLVDFAHQCISLQNIPAIDKEVEGVLLGESDPLSDDKAKLIGRQIARSQVSNTDDR